MKILTSLAFLLSGTLVWGQSSTSSAWFDYNHAQFLTADLSIVGDIGYRTNLSGQGFNLFLLRPGVNYRINSTFQVQGNISTFLTLNDEAPNSTEFRLAQEVRATWPQFKKFRFTHRLRAEERFFTYEKDEGARRNRSNDQIVRLRYFLSGTTDYKNIGPLGNIFFTSSIEYFSNLGEESGAALADESRVYAGWGQLLNRGWSYVLHLMWIRSRNDFGNFDSDEFVVRLRIYWKSQVPN
jgi:hypothetical protein